MKHTLAKLTGLMLALCLMLTGCNLITVDPVMQLDENLKALKEDYATVLATYDGGEITKGEVMANFLYMYSYYGYMYAMMGYDVDGTMVDSFKENAIEVMIQNRIIEKKFDEMGLVLTEEKKAELAEELEATWQEAYDHYSANAVGDTEEVRKKQADYDMYRDGYVRDLMERELITATKYDMVIEKIRGEITEITEEELAAGYETRVAEDEDAYNYDYAAFEAAMMDEASVVTWMPEGYRTVKHILVIPEDDVLNAVNDARDAYEEALVNLADFEEELADVNDDDAEDTEDKRTAEEVQADIDALNAKLPELKTAVEDAEAACLASVQDKLDAIYGDLEAGKDFNELIAAYGEDPGMQEEPTKSRGYYVSADSESWDPNFTDGAMLLENVGDVSETPVIGMRGLHIIRYESDVPAGAVPFEEIRDSLYDILIETARDNHANELLMKWNQEINPQYDISKFVVNLAEYGY